MASADFACIRIYLHKTEDADLLKYIINLPRSYRRHFFVDGLRDHLNRLQSGKPSDMNNQASSVSSTDNFTVLGKGSFNVSL